MSGAPKRLSKVARELNVGTSTIVDFLQSKGFDVESNPNAKLTIEMYDKCVDQYAPDRAAKERSQELKRNRVERKTITLDGVEEVEETSSEESTDEPAVEKAAAVVEEKKEEPKAPEVKEESAPVEEPKEVVAEEKPAEKAVEKPVEEPKVEAKEEPKKKQVQITPVAESGDEMKGGPKVLGTVDLDKIDTRTRPEKKKKEAPKPKKEAPAKPVAKKPEVKEAPKKKEKDQERVRPEEIKVQTKKLDGPNIVGKIELPADNKRKKKPVASSSDNKDTESKGKKRRRRIQPDGKPATPGNNQGGAGNNRQGAGNARGRGGRNDRRKAEPKPQLTEEQIQKEIKETLARLSGGGKSKTSKFRREKRQAVAREMEERMAQEELEKKILKVTEFVTVSELASMMDVSVSDVISACMALGMMVSINQRLDAETLNIVAEEFGYEVEFTTADLEMEIEEEEDDNPEDMKGRPPIVTVMGHVDHGKTSLLDYVRKANVIAGEAGGITQHIGAYNVSLEDGREVTFLDTPGHEAFTAMRARGAQVTDIVVVVIAADDSVMPQTKEAINHAQAAGVPMVFAFNKIDKPGANADKIREELSAMNILVEDWGGKYQCQEISAKSGLGVDDLLEKVVLEAELLELKANPERRASGTVIEASLDKGRGYVATLLVQQGTMRVGDILVAGQYTARVKAMTNERGQRVTEAGPSHPVQMLGFNGAPNAGDTFKEYADEREAKAIATKREQLMREQGIRAQKHITLDEIGRRLALGDFQELNIIIKGDVDGSVEALSDSLIKLSTDSIQVNVIHKQVGQITESDVLLATASDAIIVGFQVRPSPSARKLAEKEEIDIRLYSVIYKAIDEIKDAMSGMLKPKFEEKIVGNIEVRETFKISKVGTIAGCYVLDGTITRNTKIRLIRDGVVIYSGALGSLKRFKDDVKEVKAGYECGLNIENFNDIKIGDIIEGFEEVEVEQTL